MKTALSAVFLKPPRAQPLAEDVATLTSWDETSLPLIVSSVVMLVCAVGSLAGWLVVRALFRVPEDNGKVARHDINEN